MNKVLKGDGKVVGVLAKVRGRLVPLSFLLCVALPTLVYFLYAALIATPQYQSEFRIQIRTPNGNTMPSIGSLLGMTGASNQATDNGYAVTQYMASRDALDGLQKAAQLRERYSRSEVDWFSRLAADAPVEKVQRYWARRMTAHFEATTGTVIVTVSAFTPDDTLKLAKSSLTLSESLLNGMTERSRADAVRYAKQEVKEAEKQLRDQDIALLNVRKKTGIIDVPKQVTSALARTAKLQENIDIARADTEVRRRNLAPGSPGLQLAEQRLSMMTAELAASKAEMTSASGRAAPSLAVAADIFAQMEARHLFSEKRLQAALIGLNAAENDAQRQQLYLERIVTPQLPQEAIWPRPLLNSLVFLGFALAAWALVMVLGFAVRDHIPN